MIAAGVLSDLLFVVAFHGPIVAVLFYGRFRRVLEWRTAAFVLVPVLAGTATAEALDQFLIREGIIGIDWWNLPAHIWAFLSSPVALARAAPLAMALAFGVPLAGSLWFWLTRNPTFKRGGVVDAAAFWWLASVTGVLGTIAATSLVYSEPSEYRYTMPLLWWPIILSAAMVVRASGRARHYVVPIGLGSATAALGGTALAEGIHPPAVLAWHHPLEACLLDAREKSGLKAGLGNYWHARAIEASTEWRLQIDEIGRDGAGWYFGNDRFWYTHDIHDGARAPDYNYIVLLWLDEREIQKRYGAPSRVLDCPGSPIWIYDDSVALRRNLVKASPDLYATFLELGRDPREICVPADRFVSADHDRRDAALEVSDGPLTVRAETPNSRQPRIWGPYFSLPRGRWRLTLAYSLVSDSPGQDRWDLTSEYGWVSRSAGPLPATGDTFQTLTADLDLASPARGIQLRAFLAGTGVVEVKSLGIAPVSNGKSELCKG